jgi:hypothetical protein
MKYFLHDCNAFDDEKICELFMEFGYEGIGLFYVALEKIGKQEKPIKTSVLKSQLKVGKRLEKCWKFMEKIGIINTLNGESFNENILNFSEKYTIKKEKTRKKISEWRENQIVTKNVTSYKVECNPPKVKESKVNENKEDKESPVIPLVVNGSWEYEKKSFLNNEGWQIQFCTQKGIQPMALKTLMTDFINDIELKTDYKEAKELRNHFTNYFNLLKRNKPERKPHEERGAAPLKTAYQL